ncbi:MAG: hypothetical protein H6623_04270 [Bdellovibrionaceae bacterium]|nr:hypothetical protein [Pseudobdellovibrionaceae bacterium]
MFAMNLDKLNINEAELKAYIYQQLNDMEPYVGGVPVTIKMAYTKDGEFIVKMHASHDVGDIEAESSGTDIFRAISEAKHALIRSVTSLDNALSEDWSEESPFEPVPPEKRTLH